MTPPKGREIESPFTQISPRVNMARIMHILIRRFEADESELHEKLEESFRYYSPGEKEARERDKREFLRLQESRPPIAELEADIAREADAPSMRVLVDMEKETGTRTPNGINAVQILVSMRVRGDKPGKMIIPKPGTILRGEEIIHRCKSLERVAQVLMETGPPRMKLLEYNGEKVAEPEEFPQGKG